MARLTIEQIKAPDLSVASQATARAGEAFREGMSSASDLLSQYQSGIEAQGDAKLTNLLAGAKNEDEWNSILATTDFSKMNISAGMRDSIMNRRDNILGYENQRADTRLVDANTGNVNATADRTRNATRIDTNQDNRSGNLHGVAMADHAWRQGARAEDAGLAPAALRAAEENVTNGYSQPGVSGLAPENVSGLNGSPGTNLGPRADGSGLRDPSGASGTDRQIAYRNGIAAIESDGSGGYDAVGARHETLGRALGRYQIMEANIGPWSRAALGREVTADEFMANPDIQDAIFDHQFGRYVERHGEENAARAWFGGEGGINNTGASDVHGRLTIGDYGREFVDQLGDTPSRAPRERATQNPNQGGPAQQAYLDALANSQYQSSADVLAAYERQYDYNETGQAALSAENERIGREIRDQALVDGIIDPNNFRPGDLISDVFNNPNLTASERLAAIEAARQTEETAGTLFSPTVTSNPVLDAVTQAQIDTNTRNFNNSPANQFIVDADKYNADPVAFLQEKLDLSNDSQALPEETVNNISRYIDDIIADNPNVSRGEVVAAMERSFVKDPGDDDNSSFWYNSDMTLNTIERRFPEREIKELLDQFAGPEARNRYDSLQIANLSTRTGIEDATYQRTQLLTQAQKYPVGSFERTQLEQEAERFENLLFSGNSDATISRKLLEYIEETPSISQRLSGLDPNSVEYDRALVDIEAGIQSDRSLSSTDKRLMIAALRG